MTENNWRNPEYIIKLVGILALAAVVIVAILRDRLVSQPPYQINVTGQGRVVYQPDIASLTLGVQVDKAKDAAMALQLMNDKMNKITAALEGIGLSAEDIQTQNYTLYPQYDYRDGVSTLAGYNANQQLVVKVREINKTSGKLAKVISAASQAGANQVLGIVFDVSNGEELKQEARLKAITEARGRSGALAQAANVKLGKIVGWWENIIQAPGVVSQYYGDKGGVGGGVAPAPQIPVGTGEIIIEITLNYKIE